MSAEKQIANILGVLISIAAIAASAQVSISLPESVSVAPITAQSLAVLLVGIILKWKWGTISIVAYCLIGALGVPVFSDFEGGLTILLGNTIGYFIGFMVAVFVVGLLAEKQESKFPYYLLQMFIGTLIILLFGWLGLLRFLDPEIALRKGILPFLPGALAKIVLGAILLSVYRRFKNFMSGEKVVSDQ